MLITAVNSVYICYLTIRWIVVFILSDITMYLLYKVVFILVLLGCVSEMFAAPVKLREAVVSDAAENKAVDEKVREQKSNNYNLNW